MKKKLLIYAHYYVPDVASTGQLLRELAEGMLDTFDITIICVVPSYGGTIENKYKKRKYYKENINGVKVLRVRVPEFSKSNKISRVKNILGYFFGGFFATFKVGRQDYVFSISQPPVLGGLLGVC
ncbi:MAG: glycosyltransferase WbuB, partial [Ruminococcus sp.]|nr:glycosyltransferase WbuB [Ruminococcus sp.]